MYFKKVGKYQYYENELQPLGEGTYGRVYKGTNTETNEIVAVKVMHNLQSTKKQENLLKAMQAQNSIVNAGVDGVVRIIENIEQNNSLYIIQQYCNGKNLANYIAQKGGFLLESEVQDIFDQIIIVLKCMVQKKIMHRDLKPANILLHNKKIKICDFDTARSVADPDKKDFYTIAGIGTPKYIPYELIFGEEYSSKYDVFSIGMLLFDMLYGIEIHPFFPEHYKKIMNKEKVPISVLIIYERMKEICKNGVLPKDMFPDPKIYPQFQPVNHLLKDLIQGMLYPYEDKRLSLAQVFEHMYFQDRKNQKQIDQAIQIDEYTNPFNKALYNFRSYLQKNLFIGSIQEQNQSHQNQKQKQGPENYQKMENSLYDTDEKLENQAMVDSQTIIERLGSIGIKAEDVQQTIEHMHCYNMYCRNVAMFFFNLAMLLQADYQVKIQSYNKLLLSNQKTLQLMNRLFNVGLLHLNRVKKFVLGERLHKKIQNNDHATDISEYYLKSSLYRSDKALINQDSDITNYCLEAICQEMHDLGLQILPSGQKDVDLLYDEVKLILLEVQPHILTLRQSSLKIIRFFQFALDPEHTKENNAKADVFSYDKEQNTYQPSVKFSHFYYFYDQVTSEELVRIILEFLNI